jgi:TonB family protein
MKARASHLVILLFTCLTGASAHQDQNADYFLPPPCGGSPAPKARPISVTTQTLARHRISGILPVYPEVAKKAGIHGVVSLNVKVDEHGRVSEVEIWAGKPILAQAASRAVRNWTYRPVLIEDEPFAVSGEVVFTFRLGKKPVVEEGGDSPIKRVACSSPGGELLQKVEPEYPKAAKAAHVAGDVVLEILIDKRGNVVEVNATSGHPLLIESAVNAVRQWKYQPYMLDDGPVAVKSSVTVAFHM